MVKLRTTILKLYLKNKIRPFFVCEMEEGSSKAIIEDLKSQLNNKKLEVVEFGEVCFARSEFHHYIIIER